MPGTCARRDDRAVGWAGDDWALVTETPFEGDDRFIREMTSFTELPDGTYRRDFERHDSVLIDTALVPQRLASVGVDAEVMPGFGTETLPTGLVAIVGRRPASE